MSSLGSRDRWYSSPPNSHALAMQYGWNPLIEQTGGANTVTGNWAPIQIDASGNAMVSPQPSMVGYQSFITGTTGSQILIPVGAYDWTVTVQSGTAFINGQPIFAGSQVPIAGGLIGIGSKLTTAIAVGCTGGRVLVTWDV